MNVPRLYLQLMLILDGILVVQNIYPDDANVDASDSKYWVDLLSVPR